MENPTDPTSNNFRLTVRDEMWIPVISLVEANPNTVSGQDDKGVKDLYV